MTAARRRPAAEPESAIDEPNAVADESMPSPDGLPRRAAAGRRRGLSASTAPARRARARAAVKATAEATARASGGGQRSALPEGRRARPAERASLEVARRIVELAEDKKAADIVLLDLNGLTTIADYFVIASGGSERQLDAIADGVVSGMRDEKIRPFGREGTAASHWVLLDFGSVVVHVFTPPERDYYQLERHWAEARTVLRLQ